MEVYQLPYWVYQLTLSAGLVDTFDNDLRQGTPPSALFVKFLHFFNF